jgi:hypothetical protein
MVCGRGVAPRSKWSGVRRLFARERGGRRFPLKGSAAGRFFAQAQLISLSINKAPLTRMDRLGAPPKVRQLSPTRILRWADFGTM